MLKKFYIFRFIKDLKYSSVLRPFTKRGVITVKCTCDISETKARILKALNIGANPFEIIDIAADCISRLSDDNLFSEQCRSIIYSVYAHGLSEPQAAKLQINELSERYDNISMALCSCSDIREKERLRFSMRQIQQKTDKLKLIKGRSKYGTDK